MKVVLNADIGRLGHKGDIVEVAPGYARNYLLPQNLALTASKGVVRQAQDMRRARVERERRERATAEALAASIGGLVLKIPARAGEDGQLFGSVTTSDISEALGAALSEPIDRRKITVPTPIRSLGVHEYAVHLRPDLTVAGSVEVVAIS
ncbi:MAG TPA: 50S ribosomal protein L9 [Actinomycetota bacterium]|nr:50S ribosomal protein L9 [Actinomycetota bacterium]